MGYVTISNELIDELNPHEILVYLGIKRHYPKAHPSLDRIAAVCGLSLAAVKRALKSLRDRGLVLVRRTGRSNWYVVEESLPEPSDGSVRAIRKLSLSHKEEQVRNPSEETKPLLAARAGQEAKVKQIGLPDEHPDEDEAKAGRRRVLAAWAVAARNVGVTRWNKGLLNKCLFDLRKQGYTDDEIQILLEHFFARDPQNLRTKSREIDLAILFNQALNSGLEARCEEALRRHRDGEGTMYETIGARTRAMVERYMQEDRMNKEKKA